MEVDGQHHVPAVLPPGKDPETIVCALGSTQPLKMSIRIFLGVKTAGA
jgi:hypothetical protein